MLSVTTLMDLTTALVSLDLDSLEMEHHAPVNHQAKCILNDHIRHP